jgi:Cu/Ag efflux pump CusA
MLNKIIELSLNNRLLVLLWAGLLSAFGLVTIRSMEVDVFPDLTAPTVTILTESHGMEAEEVERLVTFQIETGLNGSPNVRRIRSSSAAGISIVWVEFEWGTEIYRARQIVSEKLPMIREKLPAGIGEPTLAPISSIMGEIMLLSVSSDSIDPMTLRTIADWDILPRLKSINGVANAIVIGGEYKEYQILANPLKMNYYGVSLHELETAVAASNLSASGGFYNEFGNQYVIKGEGRVYSTQEIEKSFVKMKGDLPVKIEDVAEVVIAGADKIGDASLNTKPAVVITISKQPQANTLELTKKLDFAVEELKNSLPEGVNMRSDIFKQSDFIQASVSNLQQTLMEGAFFVVIILFLFLMFCNGLVILLIL